MNLEQNQISNYYFLKQRIYFIFFFLFAKTLRKRVLSKNLIIDVAARKWETFKLLIME